jgi:hypothetical protein
MTTAPDSDRRRFLNVAGKIGASLIVGAGAVSISLAQEKKQGREEGRRKAGGCWADGGPHARARGAQSRASRL